MKKLTEVQVSVSEKAREVCEGGRNSGLICNLSRSSVKLPYSGWHSDGTGGSPRVSSGWKNGDDDPLIRDKLMTTPLSTSLPPSLPLSPDHTGVYSRDVQSTVWQCSTTTHGCPETQHWNLPLTGICHDSQRQVGENRINISLFTTHPSRIATIDIICISSQRPAPHHYRCPPSIPSSGLREDQDRPLYCLGAKESTHRPGTSLGE